MPTIVLKMCEPLRHGYIHCTSKNAIQVVNKLLVQLSK